MLSMIVPRASPHKVGRALGAASKNYE